MLFCGMALGHMDPAPPVNQVRLGRAPLSEFATLSGFESLSVPDPEKTLASAEVAAWSSS
jgi:hypothetical protein